MKILKLFSGSLQKLAFFRIGKSLSLLPAILATHLIILTSSFSNVYAATTEQSREEKPSAKLDEFEVFENKIDNSLNSTDKLEPIVLDGISYKKSELILDFLGVAFSNTLWLENTPDPSSLITSLLQARDWHENNHVPTWLNNYITPTKGLPLVNVINKFQSPKIKVGIGLPLNADFFMNWDKSKIKDPLWADIIKQIITDINLRTGISLEFIDSEISARNTMDLSGIRILPILSTGQYNKFKSYIFSPNSHGFPVAGRLVSAVEFTPYAKAQVDGFLVPKPNNAIGFSICRILSDTPKAILTALISECLIRSLGLPEISKLNEKSYIGHWNSRADENSKTIKFDGYEARDVFGERGIKTVAPISLNYDDNRVYELPNSTAKTAEKSQITDFDAKMLRVLYCSDLTPGMDRMHVLDILTSSTNCQLNIQTILE